MLTIYSKANCPYCTMAKTYLTNKNINFTEVKIDENPGAREFMLSEGHRSVPQIYKNGQLFVAGGYQGLIGLTESVLLSKLEI